jgi:hypothetical protein
MLPHQITTASLLRAIDDQRADEASSRWEEITRDFMTDDVPDDEDGLEPDAGSRPGSV